eukprot:scaffold1246_cov134-Cylindrotheca_fusiformis.AAC.2
MSKIRLEKSNILMVVVEKGGGFSFVFDGAKSSLMSALAALGRLWKKTKTLLGDIVYRIKL